MPLRFVLILLWCIRVCVCVRFTSFIIPLLYFPPLFSGPPPNEIFKKLGKGWETSFEKIIRETKAGGWRNYESLRGRASLRGRVR